MTPRERLDLALCTICWGAVELSEAADINYRTVRRWLSGQNDAPDWLLVWLETLAAFHDAHPVPRQNACVTEEATP